MKQISYWLDTAPLCPHLGHCIRLPPNRLAFGGRARFAPPARPPTSRAETSTATFLPCRSC
ncbi:hypothetical protein [Streptomyces griseus]|uniref:hypothetical protein n=1 Tax=Streptomyces griseus TaxID=1911 RepID=UPI000AD3557C|nr:hypothetical protein [Streptomyces griseus]